MVTKEFCRRYASTAITNVAPRRANPVLINIGQEANSRRR